MLPDRLDPLRKPVCEGWTLVEEITAPVLDTMIRRMGWHFLCVLRPYCRRGFGVTDASTAQRALAGGLNRLARQYNAAEFISIQSKNSLGLHVATVTLQPRLIEELTWLDFPVKKLPRVASAG